MSYTTTITGNDLAISLATSSLTVDLTKIGAQGASGLGVTWRNEWITGTVYNVNDVVLSGGNNYICVVDHTAAALFATDLTAVNWQLMLSNQGDFASASQGALADTSLQPDDLGVTVQAYDANIVSDATYVATANDFTTVLKGKLDGIEALADVTDVTNVTAAGALMDSELTNIAAVKALDQGVATTDSPTFVNITATSISGDGSALTNLPASNYADGTAAAPSITFTNDTDTGLYLSGTNSIGISTAGTEAVTFNGSGASTAMQVLSNDGLTTLLNIDETTDDLLQVINSSDVVLFEVSNTSGINMGPTSTPATAAATGTAGQIAWDTGYIYICTATDTWKRVAIATW
jgi:hypothetical protein